MARMSYGRRITQLAELDPERPAVTCGESTLTRRQLEQRANRLAHDFLGRGVDIGDMVTIAAAELGRLVRRLRRLLEARRHPAAGVGPAAGARELQAIVELADPTVVVGARGRRLTAGRRLPVGYQPPTDVDDSAAARRGLAGLEGADLGRLDRPAEADRVRRPGRRSTTSAAPACSASAPTACLVMPGPLYHNGPLVWSCQALLARQPRRGAAALRRRGDARRHRARTGPTSSTSCPR